MGEAKRKGSKKAATEQHKANEADFIKRLKMVEEKHGIKSELMRKIAKELKYDVSCV